MAPVSLGSNVTSLTAQRLLNRAADTSSRVFERLSSGQRINRAADDAAGLAIASDLSARTRVYGQAIRNINDGISVIAIADGAVQELSGIVVRIRELAEQSANGTYSNKQRAALDLEAQTLAQEFSRVSRSASFNGLNLFDGSLSQGLRLQLGYGNDGGISSRLGAGLGTGTFEAPATYAQLDVNTAIKLADLNGDGILDAALSGAVSGGVGTVEVRFGREDGTFGATTTYTMNFSDSIDLTMGDINGDGQFDLITAGYGASGGEVGIRLNRGDGTFGALSTFHAHGSGARGAILGDLNGDGKLDLVTSGYNESDVAVWLGNGNGTFSAGRSYLTTGYVEHAVTLGDLNRDGILDIVSVTDDGTGIANIRIGRGDGTFNTAVTYAMEANFGQKVDLGDLNGDGVLDLVTGGSGGGIGRITVRLGTGSGTFGAATSYTSVGTLVRDLTLADLNGDGALDVATAGDGEIQIRLGSGSGTFGAAVTYATLAAYERAIAAADVNGDGVLDLLSSGNNGGTAAQFSVRLAKVRDGISPIVPFTLRTQGDALQAMGMLDRTLTNLAKQRGTIGAFESRLSAALSTVTSTRENYTAAKSRVLDADIAEESALLTRIEIQKQAGAAVLAQANQLPALALSLLRG